MPGPRYGFRQIDGKLQKHPVEQRVISDVIRLRSIGFSIIAVTEEINKYYKNRFGRPFSKESIRRLAAEYQAEIRSKIINDAEILMVKVGCKNLAMLEFIANNMNLTIREAVQELISQKYHELHEATK